MSYLKYDHKIVNSPKVINVSDMSIDDDVIQPSEIRKIAREIFELDFVQDQIKKVGEVITHDNIEIYYKFEIIPIVVKSKFKPIVKTVFMLNNELTIILKEKRIVNIEDLIKVNHLFDDAADGDGDELIDDGKNYNFDKLYENNPSMNYDNIKEIKMNSEKQFYKMVLLHMDRMYNINDFLEKLNQSIDDIFNSADYAVDLDNEIQKAIIDKIMPTFNKFSWVPHEILHRCVDMLTTSDVIDS